MGEYIYSIAQLTASDGKLDKLKSLLADLAARTAKKDDESAHGQTPHLKSAIEKLTMS